MSLRFVYVFPTVMDIILIYSQVLLDDKTFDFFPSLFCLALRVYSLHRFLLDVYSLIRLSQTRLAQRHVFVSRSDCDLSASFACAPCLHGCKSVLLHLIPGIEGFIADGCLLPMTDEGS